MDDNVFEIKRKSYIKIGELYFWTATINNWQKLLLEDQYKDVILNSLKYLSNTGKIHVYSFVIMPNHIHLIWKTNELNGKETAQGSFLKYTAHEFKKLLKNKENNALDSYVKNAANKQYEFWQRDSLAIHLFSKEIAYQKLEYIHNNPLAEHWKLAKVPHEYKFSSANFYETGNKDFDFLKDIRTEF